MNIIKIDPNIFYTEIFKIFFSLNVLESIMSSLEIG